MAEASVRFINPDTMHEPRGYSHVAEVSSGRIVFTAGQVAIDKAGNTVGAGDMAAQATQVFENLKAALEAAGGGLQSLVKITYFITDASQIAAVREVRSRYLSSTNPPASTLLVVAGLASPDFLIEVEGIAVV